MSEIPAELFANINIARVISFFLILSGVIIITNRLLNQLIYAFTPESKSLRVPSKPRFVRVAIAVADIIAWLLGVMIACSVHKLTAVTQLMLSFLGIVWGSIPLIIIVVLVIYCLSSTGNELLLSLLGGWYLPYRQKILDDYGYFDLGDGQEGLIETINLLDTTFRLKQGGNRVVRNNAFLMHEVFGFAKAIGIEGIVDWLQKQHRNQ